MTHYDRLKRKRLGDLLIDEEVASKEAVITALHEHQQSGTPISEILIQGGELREHDLARVVVEQYQLPFIDLVSYTLHRELIGEYPARLLHQACMVPLDRFADVVCFAVQEFPAEDMLAELRKHGAQTIFVYTAMAAEIRQVLHEHASLSSGQFDSGVTIAQQAGAPIGVGLGEDGAWKELFDAANESVVSDLDESAPECEDEAPADAEPVEAQQPDGDTSWLNDVD